MPDRGKFWSPVPDWSTADIRLPDLEVTVTRAGTVWMVSGDLPRFLARRHQGATTVGPRDVCGEDRYALRLAPDRLLFVSGTVLQPEPMETGWSADGIALTDVSDAFVLLDIAGPAASDLMALGTAYDFASEAARPQESAIMLFAGLKICICRRVDGWRLHVERPHAAPLWHWLVRATSEYARAEAPAGASSSH